MFAQSRLTWVAVILSLQLRSPSHLVTSIIDPLPFRLILLFLSLSSSCFLPMYRNSQSKCQCFPSQHRSNSNNNEFEAQSNDVKKRDSTLSSFKPIEFDQKDVGNETGCTKMSVGIGTRAIPDCDRFDLNAVSPFFFRIY